MKKYFLIPTAAAQRFLQAKPTQTTIPPEVLTTSSLPATAHDVPDVNPSLQDLISTQLYAPSETIPAYVILDYFRKIPIVKWNEKGVLTSPVPGVKLVELLKFMIRPNYVPSPADRQLISELRELITLPSDFIRNEFAHNVNTSFLQGNFPYLTPRPPILGVHTQQQQQRQQQQQQQPLQTPHTPPIRPYGLSPYTRTPPSKTAWPVTTPTHFPSVKPKQTKSKKQKKKPPSRTDGEGRDSDDSRMSLRSAKPFSDWLSYE